MMPMAILCGGLATRMRPVTETLPKSLIDVEGEPFIVRQLRLLAERGLTDAVLCVGRMGEMIRDRVGDGGEFSMHIEYSSDGETLLGTGGALKRALPLLGDAFFVLYGDSYLECDYRAVGDAFAGDPRAFGLMTVFENRNRFDASNVVFREGRIVRYDKKSRTSEMHHIDYGLGVLRREALADVSSDAPSDLAEVYRALAEEGRLAGYEVRERFYEIGSPDGLAELKARVRAAGR